MFGTRAQRAEEILTTTAFITAVSMVMMMEAAPKGTTTIKALGELSIGTSCVTLSALTERSRSLGPPKFQSPRTPVSQRIKFTKLAEKMEAKMKIAFITVLTTQQIKVAALKDINTHQTKEELMMRTSFATPSVPVKMTLVAQTHPEMETHMMSHIMESLSGQKSMFGMLAWRAQIQKTQIASIFATGMKTSTKITVSARMDTTSTKKRSTRTGALGTLPAPPSAFQKDPVGKKDMTGP